MSNLLFIIIACAFLYVFWGPHNKSKKPKDDKKGGGDKGWEKK